MNVFANAQELRAKVFEIVLKDPVQFHWAEKLPVDTLDEATFKYLTSDSGSPKVVIESCNPFAVAEQLSEVTSLYEATLRLRNEGLTLEANLMNEVIAESLADALTSSQKVLEQLTVDAEWRGAGKSGSASTKEVVDIFALQAAARNMRAVLRADPGHPFNLLEQIIDIRERYRYNLQRLFGKACAASMVLKESFGHSTPSILQTCLSDSSNPLPLIGRWLRDVAFGMEARVAREKTITIYRLLQGDGLTNQDVRTLLGSSGDAEFSFRLSDKNLGLVGPTISRVLGVGVMPVFGATGYYASEAVASQYAAWTEEIRSNVRQISFDIGLTFESMDMTFDGASYHFPEATAARNGTGSWHCGDGPTSDALQLRSSPYLFNRPTGGEVRIAVGSKVRTIRGVKDRNSIFFGSEETRLTDLLVGIKLACQPQSS